MTEKNRNRREQLIIGVTGGLISWMVIAAGGKLVHLFSHLNLTNVAIITAFSGMVGFIASSMALIMQLGRHFQFDQDYWEATGIQIEQLNLRISTLEGALRKQFNGAWGTDAELTAELNDLLERARELKSRHSDLTEQPRRSRPGTKSLTGRRGTELRAAQPRTKLPIRSDQPAHSKGPDPLP